MSYPSVVRRPSRDSKAPGPGPKGAGSAARDRPSPQVREERRALLGSITEFTIRHDLAVTGPNLSAICGALSGSNGPLAEAFAARESAGEPIDQRWLDTIVRLDPGSNDRMSELERLMDRLEYSLMRFAQTAKSAQDETSDGREALGAHIDAIARASESVDRPSGGTVDMAQVLDLARVMLERIERVEQAMERSQSESAQLRSSLAKARMEADVDHLTRLPNRRAFERRFASAAKEARAKGIPLCVAFCDVDHFKAVNDTHGHEAGDRILCAIASTLNEIAGDQCFVSRHGGEEFVLLFYGLDKEAAWRKLDGLRRVLAGRQLMNRETGKPFGKITFSGGIAEVTEDADDRSALTRADAALYEAKSSGRNRIVSV
ncbi:GGDEF domain-containing protein [Erythrobacter sp. JK5]|uniref:GGDEF domain-containing protein n=1 Tax=Erythrobacter sp. JK5 TaxID=2829500 RepID=UPI001BA4E16C|nr:GGDEF domain-containing protein [Erythrobacter sp. JK5]QUL36931.1 GGDEF domain-containing protein [Erythrobacter sp. JK5]